MKDKQYHIILRTPCLPMKMYYSSYSVGAQNIIVEIEKHLETSRFKFLKDITKGNHEISRKYIRRASYRTAFADIFVDEVLLNSDKSTLRLENTNFDEICFINQYLYLNPFIISETESYYFYSSNQTRTTIEKNGFLVEIVQLFTKSEYMLFNDILEKLKDKYAKSDIEEAIDILIDSEFILVKKDMKQASSKSKAGRYYLPSRLAQSKFTYDLAQKDVREIYIVLSLLLNSTICKFEEDAKAEFLEKYGEKLVAFTEIMKNEPMMELMSKIRIQLDSNSEMIQYIKAKSEMSPSEIVYFKVKELKKFLSKNKKETLVICDVFANLYSLDSKSVLFDLDTGHSIYQHTTTSKLFSNALIYKDIDYDFREEGLIYTSKKNREIAEEIEKINYSNIYIGILNGRFTTYYREGDRIAPALIIKKNLVHIENYPLPMQVILVCSDYINAGINLINGWQDDENRFITKRIQVGRVIIRRKRWNFGLLRRVCLSFDIFKKEIENLIIAKKLDRFVICPMGDAEKLLNLSDEHDLKYLFHIAKDKNCWVKEDMQKYSPFVMDNEKYANQLILSPTAFKEVDDINTIELSNSNDYRSNKYITIRIKKKEWNIYEIKEYSLKLMDKLNVFDYFYTLYKCGNEHEFRLRIRIDRVIDFITILSEEVQYRIEEFVVEKNKYASCEEFQLIELFRWESIYRKMYMCSNDEQMVVDVINNTITYLNFFCKCNYNRMLSILDSMVDYSNKLLIKLEKIIYEEDKIVSSKLAEVFSDRSNKVPDSEIRALIHMSNNKICGTLFKIERNAYKLTKQYIESVLYIDG